ncbi:hypothetical protein KM043_006061 [Ampulex compressa]|nr:hypothetical protein KM043_006061 [Ampulex compressa]
MCGMERGAPPSNDLVGRFFAISGHHWPHRCWPFSRFDDAADAEIGPGPEKICRLFMPAIVAGFKGGGHRSSRRGIDSFSSIRWAHPFRRAEVKAEAEHDVGRGGTAKKRNVGPVHEVGVEACAAI